MSEPLTYRRLLPKFAKVWLAMLVYTFGVVGLVSVTRAPFWVAQVAMGVAAVAMLIWFWRTFDMTKRHREQDDAMAETFRKKR
jgi:membrane protein implicated in regulation of membrane protease activity